MPKEKVQREIPEPSRVGNYLLGNLEKLDRALNGTIARGGQLTGGVGRDASPEAILAEYDRVGGAIYDLEGNHLALGSFYDFENHRPRALPQPTVKAKPKATKLTEETVGDEPKKKKLKSPADENN